MAKLSNSNPEIPQLDSPGQIDLFWLEVSQLNHKIKGKTWVTLSTTFHITHYSITVLTVDLLVFQVFWNEEVKLTMKQPSPTIINFQRTHTEGHQIIQSELFPAVCAKS